MVRVRDISPFFKAAWGSKSLIAARPRPRVDVARGESVCLFRRKLQIPSCPRTSYKNVYTGRARFCEFLKWRNRFSCTSMHHRGLCAASPQDFLARRNRRRGIILKFEMRNCAVPTIHHGTRARRNVLWSAIDCPQPRVQETITCTNVRRRFIFANLRGIFACESEAAAE